MPSLTEALKQALATAGALGDPVFTGIVTEVSEATHTLTVAPDDAPEALVREVRYVPVAVAELIGMVFTPAVNSAVLCLWLDGDHQSAIVVHAAQHSSIAIPCTEVTFGDGSNLGAVKVQALVNVLVTIVQKVNSLITASKTHTHPANNTPSTGFGAITTITPDPAVSDLENPNLKH
jgi:hypothetical protein